VVEFRRVRVGERVNRANPDARYMRLTDEGGSQARVLELLDRTAQLRGLLPQLGDMLVKAGEPEKAVTMYRNARLTSDYETWPYRHLLDARVADAARKVEVFRRADARAGGPTIMVRSRYACMGCHQQ
jgi:site-specific recombinase